MTNANTQLALMIDLERCTGCKSCEAACTMADAALPAPLALLLLLVLCFFAIMAVTRRSFFALLMIMERPSPSSWSWSSS